MTEEQNKALLNPGELKEGQVLICTDRKKKKYQMCYADAIILSDGTSLLEMQKKLNQLSDSFTKIYSIVKKMNNSQE